MTNTQFKVLEMIAGGARNKEIAFKMGISVRTVDAHLDGARKSLEAKTTPHAVANAFRAGLLKCLLVVLITNASYHHQDMIRLARRAPTARTLRLNRREV